MSRSLLIKIILCLIICLLVGYIGSMATGTSVENWYVTLTKPSWSPPNWVFAPVWITLYVMMAIATALVWEKGTHHKWVTIALQHFAAQLALNGAWSIAFFGYQSIFFALLIIVALFITLIFTIRWYRITLKVAGTLMIPYIIWVAFALVLNFSIWQLN